MPNWAGWYSTRSIPLREAIEGHIETMPDNIVSPTTKNLMRGVLDNWDEAKYLIPDCKSLPFITKYLVYANTDHPSDEMVDDMYNEAYHLASQAHTPGLQCDTPLTPEERMELRQQERQEWGSQGHHVEGKSGSESMIDLCYIVTHPKTERLDKVLDIEGIASLRHKRGSLWNDYDCPITEIVLDMLFEGKLG